MATIKELEDALRNADAAGAHEDARAIANELQRARAQPPQEFQDEPTPTFSAGSRFDIPTRVAKLPEQAPDLLDTGREMLTSMGGATAGQILGTPFGPAGVAIGGGIGGGTANIVNQLQRMAADPNYSFKFGELLAETGTSMIPGGSVAKAGLKPVLKEGVKQAAGGLLAGNVRTAIDEGRLQTPGENLLSSVAPAVAGGYAQYRLAANPVNQAAVAAAEANRTVKSATTRKGQELGLKVSPVDLDPSTTNKQLTSLSGAADTPRVIGKENAKVVDAAVKEELGLAKDAVVTPQIFKDVREKAALPYKTIGQIQEDAATRLEALEARLSAIPDPHAQAIARADPATAKELADLTALAGADVRQLRELRDNANKSFQRWRQSGGTPTELDKALDFRDQAEKLEAHIEATMRSTGRTTLADELEQSRKLIAKTYNAEEAFNQGTGGFDPQVFARQLDRRVPLSGNLKTIAEFTQAYPRLMRDEASILQPGVDKLGLWTRSILASKNLLAGKPVLAGATFLGPGLASDFASKRLLSTPVQEAAIATLDPAIRGAQTLGPTAIRQAGQVVGAEAATPRPITQGDVKLLLEHPEYAKDFDEKFGPGSAAKWLPKK